MNTTFRILSVTWAQKPTPARPVGGFWEVAIDLDHWGVRIGSKKLASIVKESLERMTHGKVRTFHFEKAPSFFIVTAASPDSEWEDIIQEFFLSADGIVSLIHSARGGMSDNVVLVTQNKAAAWRAARVQLRLGKAAV